VTLDLMDAQQAVFESRLDSKEKLVLLALLKHWSATNPHPFPGVDRLASYCSVNRKTVMQALNHLLEIGVLARRARPRSGAAAAEWSYGQGASYDLQAVFEGRLPGLPAHPATSPVIGPVQQKDQSGDRTSPVIGPVQQTDMTGPVDGLDPVQPLDLNRSREESQEESQHPSGKPDLRLAVQEPVPRLHLTATEAHRAGPRAPAPARQRKADVQRVFEHWQQVMDKPACKFTRDRVSKVNARLNDGYTVEKLCQAIDGCKLSTFHMGDNDRTTPFNDITTILKSGRTVEEHVERAEGRAPAARGPAKAPATLPRHYLETAAR
jgi:hypothetical protein